MRARRARGADRRSHPARMTRGQLRRVNDPVRLGVLRSTQLMDSPPEESFDRITRLASLFLRAPLALVNLVDDRRQYAKSCVAPEGWAFGPEAPIEDSYCRWAVATGETVRVTDARTDPRVSSSAFVPAASVLSYLGVPLAIATTFAAVVVVSFAATTMDTGVRLQRYIIQEIGEIARIRPVTRNLTIATTLAVLFPLGLALYPSDAGGESGFAFGYLWRLFGTTNQLTAGLVLAVVAVWVFTRNRNPLAQIVPLVFLLTMTTWALVIQLGDFFRAGDWLLVAIDSVIFVLALWLIVEAIGAFMRARGERGTQTDEASGNQGGEPQ